MTGSPIDLTNCTNTTIDIPYTMSTCEKFTIYWTTVDGNLYISEIIEQTETPATFIVTTGAILSFSPYLTPDYVSFYLFIYYFITMM